MRSPRLLLGFLIVLLLATGGTSAAMPLDEEVEGVVVPLPADDEAEIFDEIEQYEHLTDGEFPDSIVALFDGEDVYLILTDEDIGTGAATFEGTEITEFEGAGVFVADEMTDYTTEGERVDRDALLDNPEQYAGELVRVEFESYNQIGVAAELFETGIGTQMIHGDYVGEDIDITNPSHNVVEAIDVLSNEDAAVGSSFGLGNVVHLIENSDVFADPRIEEVNQRAFWASDAPVTLDIALGIDGGNGFIADRQFHVTDVNSITDIQSGVYDGDIVRVDGSAAEARLSPREILEGVPPCPDGSVTVPGLCVPSAVDAPVHTGFVYEDSATNSDELIGYIGISNTRQSVPVEPYTGDVTIVGEVVDADELDVNVDSPRMLLAYDVTYDDPERIVVPEAVEDRLNEFRDSMEENLIEAGQREPVHPDDIELSVSGVPEVLEEDEEDMVRETLELSITNEGNQRINRAVRLAINTGIGETYRSETILRLDPGEETVRDFEIGHGGSDELALYLQDIETGENITDLGIVDVVQHGEATDPAELSGQVEVVDAWFVEQAPDDGPAVIGVTVENTGDREAAKELVVVRGTQEYITEEVVLEGGEREELEFEIGDDAAARILISVNDEEIGMADFSDDEDDLAESNDEGHDDEDVEVVDVDSDDDGSGFGIGGAMAALSGVGYLLKRRLTTDDRNSKR